MRVAALIISWLLLWTHRPAAAAALIADISSHQIEITSSFTGTSLLLFGAIDWAKDSNGQWLDARDHDIIVVVRGPATSIQVRKKSSIGGIWVNRRSAVASEVPGFYMVASTRSIHDILLPEEVAAYGLGLENIEPVWSDPPPSEESGAFRRAIDRGMTKTQLFAERPDAVTVLGETLFRTEIYFPATVPVGTYSAEIYLARNGVVVAHQTTPLSVTKIGLERAIYDFANTRPATYGLIAVVLALGAGLVAGAISRRLSS